MPRAQKSTAVSAVSVSTPDSYADEFAPSSSSDLASDVEGVEVGRARPARRRTRGPAVPALTRTERIRAEIGGGVAVLAACFILAAVRGPSSSALQVGQCSVRPDATGPVGSCLRAALLTAIGWPAAMALVGFVALLGLISLRRGLRPPMGQPDDVATALRAWARLLLMLVPVLPAFTGVIVSAGHEVTAWTGLWGSLVAYYLQRYVGDVGAWLATGGAMLFLLGRGVAARALRAGAVAMWTKGRAALDARRVRGVPVASSPAIEVEQSTPSTAVVPWESIPEVAAFTAAVPVVSAPSEIPDDLNEVFRAVGASLSDDPDQRFDFGPALLPDVNVLAPVPEPLDPQVQAAGVASMRDGLMAALKTFNVNAELQDTVTGPSVTRFALVPASGVKVRSFANLADDLALHMRATSVRVIAPIPGQGAVGIEVPNPTREMVVFRELVESEAFQRSKAALPVALGKDIAGRVVVADLAKMPHLLIAGATGAGKSVCVNTIIASLLFRHGPDTLRLLMVDPKMVELSVYNGLPHLRHRVIVDTADAATLLRWAVDEMEDRYALLAANGARNLGEFNARVERGDDLKTAKPGPGADALTVAAYRAGDIPPYVDGPLPMIVVIIDELADLMMQAQAEVESPLARLAQKARAIGIHLILATQRPSVNVITGLIKANFPARIAFRVASQVDSRTILDGVGAESLLGNGDMLFLPPGVAEPTRLQGAFLSSEDVEALMDWYRDQADGATEEPDIIADTRARVAAVDGDEGGPGDGARGARDPLFRQAAEAAINEGSGSTSLLQRRLGIGYGRAARIIDQLVDAGLLEEKGGPKGRRVLMGLDAVETL